MHQVALSRRGGTSIQAEVRPAPIRASHCRYPLKVKAILLDLDGTLMPTYKSLAALQYFEEQLGLPHSGVTSFVADCRTRYELESLLHGPTSARRAATEYARKHGVAISAAILRRMISLQEHSFCAYEGLRDLLDHARRAGTFVGIYTNTSCESAIRRLERSLLPPGSFNAIWAKNSHPRQSLLLDYADVLIPYDYSKPDDTPLRELAAISGASPDETLFVGDGVNDLDVVYRDKARPRAIFCLQEKGAADISDELSAFNARLRPGHTPLGLRAINSRIDRYGIDSEIIRLRTGFVGLSGLINAGRILLAATDRRPIVRDNQLVVATRCSAIRFFDERTLSWPHSAMVGASS
jgi:phosphoglycolate phosphatase-like HAD superfamily hydrolase